MTTADTRAAVARRAQNTGQVDQQAQPDLRAFVNGMSAELARAVPEHLNATRIARIALTSLNTVKHLAECTQNSFAGALMTCAQLGLEPGGPSGEAYLLPFFNKRIGQYEVQLVIGYQGMVKLFWQSPLAAGLDLRVVKENDFFDYEYGLNPFLKHKPARGNRGRSIAWYSVAHTTNGSGFLVMFREDIEEIRKRSKAKDDGPWKTDYDAMAKKTTMRQLFKGLPKSTELARALAHDETVRNDASLDALDAAPIHAPRELESGSGQSDDDWPEEAMPAAAAPVVDVEVVDAAPLTGWQVAWQAVGTAAGPLGWTEEQARAEFTKHSNVDLDNSTVDDLTAFAAHVQTLQPAAAS